jgi:hypothetical protein
VRYLWIMFLIGCCSCDVTQCHYNGRTYGQYETLNGIYCNETFSEQCQEFNVTDTDYKFNCNAEVVNEL